MASSWSKSQPPEVAPTGGPPVKAPAANDRDPLRAGALDLAEALACMAKGRGGVVSAEPRKAGGVDLLVLTAEPDFDLHRVGGKLRERIADHCEPMTPERETAVRDERRNLDWSGETTELGPESVLETSIEEARRLLEQAGDGQGRRRASQTKEDLLRECGVFSTMGACCGLARSCSPEPRWRRIRACSTCASAHRAGPSAALRMFTGCRCSLRPTVSNQTVQNLCQVQVNRASALLHSLADRDIIKKTDGSPEHGPTVRYEPRPSLAGAEAQVPPAAVLASAGSAVHRSHEHRLSPAAAAVPPVHTRRQAVPVSRRPRARGVLPRRATAPHASLA